MSADFKMTFNPDGTESKTSLNEAMKQDAPATALAPKQQGKMRVIVSEDGTTTVEQNRPTQYRAEPVQQQQQQQQQQKPAEKNADEQPAGDPRGVEPTSDASDATLKALSADTPMALEHLVTSLSQTGQVSDAVIADIARTR